MVSTGLQSLMALSPNLAQSSISMSCEGVLGFKIHFESLLVSLFALVCNPPTSPRPLPHSRRALLIYIPLLGSCRHLGPRAVSRAPKWRAQIVSS